MPVESSEHLCRPVALRRPPKRFLAYAAFALPPQKFFLAIAFGCGEIEER